MPELYEYWSRKPVNDSTFDSEGAGSQEDESKSEKKKRSLTWHEKAEVFVVTQVVYLCRQVFTQIQNMLTFLVLMLFCLLICFDSYPFQPHRLLLSLCFGLIIWKAVFVLIMMFKFNRNEVLSRIGGTSVNRLTFDRSLFLPLVTYVIVPLVGLLLVQFPVLGESLFGWVNTLKQLIRV